MPASPVFLLETKLHPPRVRADTLKRPRLYTRLDEALEHTVTLTSAPAGFGKSTLVSDWLVSVADRCATAWYSLDERDDDPLSFIHYLAEAIARAHPGLASVSGLVRGAEIPTLDEIYASILNAIERLDTDLVVVVDDLHLVSDASILDALAFLVERAPPALHFVLLSRAVPQLPLARWRARRQLLELHADDLRFTLDEVDLLIRETLGVRLPLERLAQLERHTEGWAAGLQLVALASRGRAEEFPVGAHRYLFDYLASEVWAQLDSETQRGLLALSILERVSGPLADALTGRDDGRRWLADLHRRNLFLVALDGESDWYRFHHLFLAFLDRRRREEEPGDDREFHRRASAWFEAQGLVSEAVDHAFRAGDETRALAITEHALLPAVMRGEFAAAVRWVNRFPRETIEARPGLAILLASIAAIHGRLSEARSWLEHAERAGGGAASEPGTPLWVARERVIAWLLRSEGEMEAATTRARSALELLPAVDVGERAWMESLDLMLAYERGDHADTATALERGAADALESGRVSPATLLTSAAVHGMLQRGELRRARAYAAEVYQRLVEQGNGFTIVPALIAEIAYERGELDEAERHAELAIAGDAFTGYNDCFVPPLITLARLRLARGDTSGAEEAIARFGRRVAHLETVQARDHFPALVADLRLRMGDLGAAQRWARVSGWSAETSPTHLRAFAYLVSARVRMAAGQEREAIRMAALLRQQAEADGRYGVALAARIVEAHGQARLGERARASEALAPGLALADREGYLRLFVDAGDAALTALRGVVADPAAGAHAARLLERMDGAATTERAGTELLSERECEVLRFLAAGLSNRAIADELVVSLDTVKTHVRNVYGKLDVHSRTQAVARARELRLL